MDININNYSNFPLHKKALVCAKLCKLAYDNSDITEKHKLGITIEIHDKIAHLKYKTIQYFIFETKEYQFLVIRGTDTKFGVIETMSDLLVSLNFFPRRSESGIYCHGGYSDVGDKIIEQLTRKRLLKMDKQLVVTGHSLGGALAKYMSIHVNKEIEIFTFGSPQISDKNYFNFKFPIHEFHFMNPNDWICMYPSSLFNDDKFLYVIGTNSLVCCRIRNKGMLVPFLLFTIKSIISKNGILTHHTLNEYINRLESVDK